MSEASLGRDPNDSTNAVGHLQNDRTHTFRVTGTIFAPFSFLVGVNYGWFVGKPWGGRELIDRSLLPQGNRWVYVEPPGTRRLDSQSILDLRVSRVFSIRGDNGNSGPPSVEFLVDGLNGLNVASAQDMASRTLGSSLLGVSDRWVDPRRALVGVKARS